MEKARYELAKKTILQAGKLLEKADVEMLSILQKTDQQDIVTQFDKMTESFISSVLLSEFPNDTVIGEEFPAVEGTEYVWYIDPIDGTTNFVSQRHDYCISIACYKGKEPCFGFVLDVRRNHLYEANIGRGAYRNNLPIQCAELKPVQDLVLTTPMITALFLKTHKNQRTFIDLANKVRGVRSKGSVALEMCLVAAGEADVFATVHSGPWDYAAAKIILQEAGGACGTFEKTVLPFQGDSTIFAASSEELLQQLYQYFNCKTEKNR